MCTGSEHQWVELEGFLSRNWEAKRMGEIRTNLPCSCLGPRERLVHL